MSAQTREDNIVTAVLASGGLVKVRKERTNRHPDRFVFHDDVNSVAYVRGPNGLLVPKGAQ